MSTTYQLTTIQGDTVRHARFATLESMRTAARRRTAAARQRPTLGIVLIASEFRNDIATHEHDDGLILEWSYTWTTKLGWHNDTV